ncbi:MAG: FtsQ-type POTRA domain-containing protein [Ruminococcaceae bacterium]|nr:FtsQ-type POTRA domain-containing protein [Oscillospiraceae bacterium]
MTNLNSSSQKKRNKKKKRLRRVLLLLFLLVAIISICLFTPFFNIKAVEVTGNSTVSSEQIIQAASIATESNLFKLNKRKTRKQILAIPEIEDVTIRRLLPGKVRLSVTETTPVMYFPYLSGFVTTNENGRAMAICDDASELNLIKMTGLEIKKVEICKKISVQDTVKFDIIINIISKFREKGLLSELRSCHFDTLTDFHVYLTDGTKVIFGKTTEFDYKLSVLSNILPMVNRMEGAYIDLTTPSRAFYGLLPEEETEAPPTEENLGEEGEEPPLEEGSGEEGGEPTSEESTEAEGRNPAPEEGADDNT